MAHFPSDVPPLTDDDIHRSLREGWPPYLNKRVDELRALEVARLLCPMCGYELDLPRPTRQNGRTFLGMRGQAFTVACDNRSTGVFYR